MAALNTRTLAPVAPIATKVAFLLALMVVALASGTAMARKAQDRPDGEDRREVQGRALFAKGDYQAALEIYATLFAEKSDPIYLRNIGRCYQQLEQPKNALNAFREYLRRSKVKPAERAEIDGFIQQMEELQKRQAATTPPPATEAPASTVDSSRPAAVSAPPPVTPVAETPASNNAPGATLTREGAPPDEPSGSGRSITTRWWFWTGLAVLVAGGAATAFALTRSSGGLTPMCPTNAECGPP
jgi:hypothetical protein